MRCDDDRKAVDVTDRYEGFIVALDKDIREDDAEQVINAIKMVRGVLAVEPLVAGVAEGFVVRARADNEWRSALVELVQRGPGSHG